MKGFVGACAMRSYFSTNQVTGDRVDGRMTELGRLKSVRIRKARVKSINMNANEQIQAPISSSVAFQSSV